MSEHTTVPEGDAVAPGGPRTFSRQQLESLTSLALRGVAALAELQRQAIEEGEAAP